MVEHMVQEQTQKVESGAEELNFSPFRSVVFLAKYKFQQLIS